MSKVLVVTEKDNIVFVDFGLFKGPVVEVLGKHRELVGIRNISDIKRGKEILYQNSTNQNETMMLISAGRVKEAYLVDKKVA